MCDMLHPDAYVVEAGRSAVQSSRRARAFRAYSIASGEVGGAGWLDGCPGEDPIFHSPEWGLNWIEPDGSYPGGYE